MIFLRSLLFLLKNNKLLKGLLYVVRHVTEYLLLARRHPFFLLKFQAFLLLLEQLRQEQLEMCRLLKVDLQGRRSMLTLQGRLF